MDREAQSPALHVSFLKTEMANFQATPAQLAAYRRVRANYTERMEYSFSYQFQSRIPQIDILNAKTTTSSSRQVMH